MPAGALGVACASSVSALAIPPRVLMTCWEGAPVPAHGPLWPWRRPVFVCPPSQLFYYLPRVSVRMGACVWDQQSPLSKQPLPTTRVTLRFTCALPSSLVLSLTTSEFRSIWFKQSLDKLPLRAAFFRLHCVLFQGPPWRSGFRQEVRDHLHLPGRISLQPVLRREERDGENWLKLNFHIPVDFNPYRGAGDRLGTHLLHFFSTPKHERLSFGPERFFLPIWFFLRQTVATAVVEFSNK